MTHRNSKIFSLIIVLNVFVKVNSQTTVYSDEHLIQTRQQKYNWKINRVSFQPAKERTKVYPHYPACDTIIFTNKGDGRPADTIYTRIPPKKNYIMTIGCCADGFDIYEKTKFTKLTSAINKKNIQNEVFDSLYTDSKESGRVKFIIKNKPISDTLICIYGDFAGFPYGQMITREKDYSWLSPSKGYYSSSIDCIVFAKKKPTLKYKIEKNDIISWDSPDFNEYFETIKRVQLRVFNNEKVIIEFDYVTKLVKLKFEK